MRVNYKHAKVRSSKDRKKKRIQEVQQKAAENAEMQASDEVSKAEQLGLTTAKRKQIFKKSMAKDIKAQIQELKIDWRRALS